MFKKGDIVKIKPEWLNKGEDPDTEYYVTDYNPDNGHTDVICKWNGFTGFLKYSWSEDTVYKVGHVDPEFMKKLFTKNEK